MKIAIYYPWIHLKSGVERTILETVKRSKHKYTVFTNYYDRKNTYRDFAKLKVVELKRVSVKRQIQHVAKAALTILFQKIDLSDYDLLLVHSEGLGDLILFNNHKIPVICFCHTPLRPVFDGEYRKKAMQGLSVINKGVFILTSAVFKHIDRFLWRKYKYVFFNSRESLKRARKGELVGKKQQFRILHPGVDWMGTKPTNKFDKYFLVPGRIMWTKNIELAINSFNRFQETTKKKSGFKLVIAGQVDHKSKGYFESLKLLSRRDGKIEFVINPSEVKMKILYTNCFFVLCTSFNEDWGMVTIEANSYGKAVLAVNKGGFKESQVNGKTGYLLKADPTVFERKMQLLEKKRNLLLKMSIYARNNSKQYDWSYFIESFDSTIFRLGRGNNCRLFLSENRYS